MTTTFEHVCESKSNNPRLQSTCGLCGKPLPQDGPALDWAYTSQFLQEAAKTAERRYGLSAAGFEIAVRRRLEMGEKRYGTAFLRMSLKQRVQNELEEAWDEGAYTAMDSQMRIADDVDDSATWHLFEMAVHAAAIDAHARQLRAETD